MFIFLLLFKDVMLAAEAISDFLSWSDGHSADRDLQSDGSAGSLHDRWLHDVAQPFRHRDALSISSGQSYHCIHPFNKHTYRDHEQADIHLKQSAHTSTTLLIRQN